jgi:hypothetical protein
MKCEELLKSLNDYIDGAELTEICEEFAQQLDGCNPCQVVVDNVQQTILLFKSGQPFPMPLDFQIRMQQRLQDCWQQQFPKSSSLTGGSQSSGDCLDTQSDQLP